MSDKSSRTEQPTPHRIDKARKEGQFASSRELLGAVQFLVFVLVLSRWGGAWLSGVRRSTRLLLQQAFHPELGTTGILGACRDALFGCLVPLAWVGGALVLLSIGSQLAMTRMGFSMKRLAPDFNRLNPMSRLKDLWRQNTWALAKALVILPLAGIAVWAIACDNLAGYMAMPLAGVEGGARLLADSMLGLLWKAAGVFLVLGVVDLARERRRYTQNLRMSRQELREEVKDLEGNPQVKARIRWLQRDLVRRQMMKEVKTATAVIVNPTHYAVAIRYQMESMAAPRVVAKGRGLIAQRIREIAVEHQVPLFENPPLAQALYKTVKVGQEIPAHLYRAVAEILAYIYRLMNGRLPGQAGT
ncbi:MAG: flagellar biosynthesis protein FlhB [Bryobacteraceae bacterium]